MDTVHQRANGTARRNFNENKSKLVEGEDYFVRNSSEAKILGFTAPNGITLLTESGYLLLVKSFTDDLAWKVQRQLVNGYFRAHGKDAGLNKTDSITPSEQQNLQELVDAKCRGIADQGKARAEIWSRLHHKFRVAKYSQLPRTQLTAAQLYIMGMELRCDPFSRTEPPKAAPEYLTNEDMMNLKRMVWWISHSFRFEKSWSSGLWHHLRRVTNTPSPQQFTVDQLPRIARELQIATSAAEQVKDLMMELEKEACKRIFRRAEDADMVIADIRTKAAQQLQVRRQELAKFPSYLNIDLLAITDRKTGLYPRPECDETHGYFAA